MRVLHSVKTHLEVTENWIYPQIASVPGVSGRVICSSVKNGAMYPLGASKKYLSPPSWRTAWGFARLLSACAKRLEKLNALDAMRIRPWRPEAIHAHFGPRGWESIPLSKTLQLPLITSFYGYDAWMLPRIDPLWVGRCKELFSYGKVFLVEGPAMRERLVSLGCRSERIRIQRLGVELPKRFIKHEVPTNRMRVLMVGRFVEKKGLVDGLLACIRALTRGAHLNVTIVGDASPGDCNGVAIKQRLLHLVAENQMQKHVVFKGYLPLAEVRKIIESHDVFLCPSKHAANGDAEGGSPVVLTEAMALGLICVGTRHCDIPEVIIDGATGLLCSEGNVGEMADVLWRLSRGIDGFESLIERARSHICKQFNLTTQLQCLRDVYDSVRDRDFAE